MGVSTRRKSRGLSLQPHFVGGAEIGLELEMLRCGEVFVLFSTVSFRSEAKGHESSEVRVAWKAMQPQHPYQDLPPSKWWLHPESPIE